MTVSAAQSALEYARDAREEALERYEAAGWGHLQAPTESSLRALTYAATLYHAATEAVVAAEVRLHDAERNAALVGEIERFTFRRAA